MSRKIILVDSCESCPHFLFNGVCNELSARKDERVLVPDEVYHSKTIWNQCPLDDAGGFV